MGYVRAQLKPYTSSPQEEGVKKQQSPDTLLWPHCCVCTQNHVR